MIKNTKTAKHTLYEKNKKLAREWHPTKNARLTPMDVAPVSGKKVWWICRKGHEWEAAISSRHNGTGCPYCSGKKICKDNCLKTINPKLAREWHPTKNALLTPKDVTSVSGKKVWWICRKRHEWEAIISNRSKSNRCPYCAGKKASKENCLQSLNPKLDREWHPTKNAPLTPENVVPNSHKKIWWMCGKGHEWEAVIYSRNMGNRCPYCSGQKVCKENCLKTMYPKLAREWHPAKNALLTPKDVTSGSMKKVWWICRKCHEWEAVISDRSNGTGCPYCSGRKASKENCLQTINPKLAREWHPTKNASLTPKNVTPNSHKKVWWMCRKSHEWEAVINNRSRDRGCPYCSGNKVSKENCLKTINPKLAREWHPTKNALLTPKDVTYGSNKKVWWICRKPHEWEAAITSRSRGNGCPYCAGQKVSKENCLKTVNPKLAREWHPTKNDPLTPKNVAPNSHKKVWWICRKPHEWEAEISSRSKGNRCPYCAGQKVCKENCLKTVSPRLAREWHPTKNARLTTENVGPNSRKKVWWMCSKGHEWEEIIADRYRGSVCLYCLFKKAPPVTRYQAVHRQ